jgi:hypothetical protein
MCVFEQNFRNTMDAKICDVSTNCKRHAELDGHLRVDEILTFSDRPTLVSPEKNILLIANITSN